MKKKNLPVSDTPPVIRWSGWSISEASIVFANVLQHPRQHAVGVPTGFLIDMFFAFLLCVQFVQDLLSSYLHILVGEDGHLEDVVKGMAPTLTSLLSLEVGGGRSTVASFTD